MNHYDYLMKHDTELFESLCWIYYPIIKAIRYERTEQRLSEGDLSAERAYNSDDWSFYHRELPNIEGYISFTDYSMDRTDLDFRIKLRPMGYTKLIGAVIPTKVPMQMSTLADEAFQIMNHRFAYFAEGSKLPDDEAINPDKNWAFISANEYPKAVRDFKRITASTDKVFYEWLDEIRHLSTLAKVSI